MLPFSWSRTVSLKLSFSFLINSWTIKNDLPKPHLTQLQNPRQWFFNLWLPETKTFRKIIKPEDIKYFFEISYVSFLNIFPLMRYSSNYLILAQTADQNYINFGLPFTCCRYSRKEYIGKDVSLPLIFVVLTDYDSRLSVFECFFCRNCRYDAGSLAHFGSFVSALFTCPMPHSNYPLRVTRSLTTAFVNIGQHS